MKPTTPKKPAPIFYAWIITHNATGRLLKYLKFDSSKGSLEVAGCEWNHVSAFSWVGNKQPSDTLPPYFTEECANNVATLYRLQTGDTDITVQKIRI